MKQSVTYYDDGTANVHTYTETSQPELLRDWIPFFEAEIAKVPEPYRDTATAGFDHCGYFYLDYTRPMTPEETAQSLAGFEASKALAASSTPYELDDWAREYRLRNNLLSRADALDIVTSGRGDVRKHPRYQSWMAQHLEPQS